VMNIVIFRFIFYLYTELILKSEKRKRLVSLRQAQTIPAERLLFNFLDGLVCDLEGLDAGAGQFSR